MFTGILGSKISSQNITVSIGGCKFKFEYFLFKNLFHSVERIYEQEAAKKIEIN